MPIEEVRAKLNIKPPKFYNQAHATWRAAGVDPYDLMAPVKQAA
jgi:ubiquinone biosynthesis protein COQ4